jgi:hypothetical protein
VYNNDTREFVKTAPVSVKVTEGEAKALKFWGFKIEER